MWRCFLLRQESSSFWTLTRPAIKSVSGGKGLAYLYEAQSTVEKLEHRLQRQYVEMSSRNYDYEYSRGSQALLVAELRGREEGHQQAHSTAQVGSFGRLDEDLHLQVMSPKGFMTALKWPCEFYTERKRLVLHNF